MPYFTKNKCVYKKSTGKKVGCTKGPLNKYLAALHINESMKLKNIDISTDKTKATVRYVLPGKHSAELALMFALTLDDESVRPDLSIADYAFGTIKTKDGNVSHFEDPSEIKDLLKKHGLEPDDIERRGQESYQMIEDKIRSMNKSSINTESFIFNSVYKKLLES